MTRIACVYHFFESDSESLENLQYFLSKGISDEVEYFFMLASLPKIDFPEMGNVRVIEIPNSSFDIGGYKAGFEIISKMEPWDFVFFLNSGVLGPLLLDPESTPWFEIFTSKLDSNVKMIGTTVNFLPNIRINSHWLTSTLDQSKYSPIFNQRYCAHIQSMFFCISGDALSYVAAKGIFTPEINQDKFSLVVNFEIAISQLLLSNNWNLASILKEYDNFDFIKIERDPNFSAHNGDPYYPGTYFGRNINPWDVIFFKTSRGLLDSGELKHIREL